MKQAIKTAILGYGIEGRALAKYLISRGGVELTICDEKNELSDLHDLPDHTDLRLGQNAFADLSEFELIYRSPGISLSRPELQSALKAGAKFSSVTKLFFEKCPCPIIGVSGTKGKGTTSSLTYEILKKAGKHAFLGGNIGEPPLKFLDELTGESLVVLELSSFQLEDLDKSPHISIVLNITSDHLDYHPTKEEYQKSKEPLLANQTEEDFAIINADYEGSKAFSRLGKGKKLFYSTRTNLTCKTLPGEGFAAKNSVPGRKLDPKDHPDAYLDGGNIVISGENVAKSSDIALRGDHNLENVLPACLVGKLLGASNEAVSAALKAFSGLPHRLELVAEAEGVKYFNDSFSTTPETSIAGVKAFSGPLYLIAGGSEKHSDFTDWARVCIQSPNLKMVLLIGETASRMEAALQDAMEAKQLDQPSSSTPANSSAPPDQTLDIMRVENLEAAFEFLKQQVQAGDIVLLSPACASFGLFENYKVRGETFRQLARQQAEA